MRGNGSTNGGVAMVLSSVLVPHCVRGFDSPHVLFDLTIAGAHVLHIRPSAVQNKQAASGTLVPCLVDIHVHLDKTYVVHETGAADGDLFRAIELMAAHRSRWSEADIGRRMQRAIEEAYRHGTRAMRSHLDWSSMDTPPALAVFKALRAAWQGRMALQCVSLTPLDLLDDPLAGQQIARTLANINAGAAGADPSHPADVAILGAFVYRNANMEHKLQQLFDLARQYALQLDFHVDEGLDVDASGLRHIAKLTLRNNYQGKVTCGHACSLSMQSAAEANQTLALCAQAAIHLVALPATNLYLQGAWDTTPIERGITRIKEAAGHGVKLCMATDNVADGFFPYGSYDLLESFALGVQVAHLSPADAWLGSITTAPARAMALPWDGKIAVGCPADLVLMAARNPYELVTAAGRQRTVLRAGVAITA